MGNDLIGEVEIGNQNQGKAIQPNEIYNILETFPLFKEILLFEEFLNNSIYS